MDLSKLKKLTDLAQESGIAELEITEGEEKVKIVKGGAVSIAPASVATVGLGTAPAPAEARPAPAAPAAPPAAEPEAGQEGDRKSTRLQSPDHLVCRLLLET